jgi:GT2 family glycosyltransferase/glycosyltransferase involved in cell wall biosynthesis
MQDARAVAAAAVERGLAALSDGDMSFAEAWFSRAHRIVPDDPTSALLLASSLSRNAPDDAEKLLRGLLDRHPLFGAARIALAAIRSARGDSSDAAGLLHAYLCAHSPPSDPGFARLASSIAARAGFCGWISVNCDGVVQCPARRSAPIVFTLDGNICRPGPGRGGWALPAIWQKTHRLTATLNGRHALGSPVDLRTRRSASGVVEIDDAGDLRGWAWMPADPTVQPVLQVIGSGSDARFSVVASDGHAVHDLSDGVARPRHFHVSSARLPRTGKLRVTGPDGVDLLGSPILRSADRQAAIRAVRNFSAVVAQAPAKSPPPFAGPDVMRPLPVIILPKLAGTLPPRRAGVPARQPIDIIIPVFRGADDVSSCLDSVIPTLPRDARLVLVDDGSRDSGLRGFLRDIRDPRITILRHARNRGFPAAANTGLRHAGPRDAVLLNPDTLVGAGWLTRLQRAAYARADIGSVTPLTNDGTLTAYPDAAHPAALAESAAIARLDAACAAANAGRLVELPTAVGFCMFIRHDCLAQTGLFREDVFAQGYGEETDWSLRARHLGWRHVADTSIFVAHKGGTSFGPAGRALRARNMEILERLHPGANAALLGYIADDPLFEARRRVDARLWQDGVCENGAVILITHAQGGGVERLVQARAQSWRAQGVRPIIIRPHGAWPPAPGVARRCSLADGDTAYRNLIFTPGTELAALAGFLTPDRPRAVELHQMMGHDAALGGLAGHLGVPLDMHIHDYAAICPRVTLCGRPGRYCGEPEATEACDECVADHGDRLHEGLGAAALRARSAALVSQARQVHVGTAEAARRIARYLPAAGKTIVAAREDDGALPGFAAPRDTGPGRRICVPGAIGDDKGFRILLACARDAAQRGLDVHFTVVGHTRDDETLMQTGRVFVTGQYEEDEAVALIAAHRPDLGFLPSAWPETWCYSLTLLWQAGLWPVVFDLGAQAERVAARGVGTVLPPGLPAARINDVLVGLMPRAA